jgi:regulator of CtrA degradation
MSGQFGGRAGDRARSEPGVRAPFIPFVHRLAASPAFQDLFREGMGLVDEAAAYLDGPGRVESRALPQAAALAYATESMRLTTRLMQIASWLLLQRAVNEGDLTPNQARSERRRVRLSREAVACPPETTEQWPPTFRTLSLRSQRLHERILHLDTSLAFVRSPQPFRSESALALQRERLAAAFASR